eukprot:11195938-Lingulodinium_polyedra.AAC.1
MLMPAPLKAPFHGIAPAGTHQRCRRRGPLPGLQVESPQSRLRAGLEMETPCASGNTALA